MCVTSDKLLHNAAAPPKCRSFARSLRETPLQRFHRISLSMVKFCLRVRVEHGVVVRGPADFEDSRAPED